LKRIFINEQIWAREVRLISEEGKQIGIVSREEALRIAREKNMDLIEVGPTAKPPVCRIGNFDKYRYEMEKKEKKKHQKSKKVELKEIRIGMRTGEHDLEIKKKQALKFLKKGKKVKIELVIKGRERAHKDIAFNVINNFLTELLAESEGRVSQQITGSPRGFSAIVDK